MFSQGAPAQRVPAWKRLGLKLKGPASEGSPTDSGANADQPAAATHRTQQQPNAAFDARKRKAPPTTTTARESYSPYQNGTKKARSDGPEPALRREKSVTFSSDTKSASANQSEAKAKQPKKPKKKKVQQEKPEQSKPDFDLEPALAYLRQWRSSRDAWKFNKNHQTLLIKYVFDGERIPASDVGAFYEYIRDLKGFVRTRLRQEATEVRKKDMEQGVAAFPEATKDKEAKQKLYEEVLARFLQQRNEQREKEQKGDGTPTKSTKRPFDEVEFVLQNATDIDPQVRQRIVKRLRAELVLDELSDSGESASTNATTSSSSASSGQDGNGAGPMDIDQDKRAVPESVSGPQPKAKRQRLKKMRTGGNISDERSSESESSESEDASSDSDSSSSDDSDEEAEQVPAGDNAETSSSSSSSSSESDGDSDEDSETESGEEDGGAEE